MSEQERGWVGVGEEKRREEKQSDERQNHTAGLKKQFKNVLLLYVFIYVRHKFGFSGYLNYLYRLQIIDLFPY